MSATLALRNTQRQAGESTPIPCKCQGHRSWLFKLVHRRTRQQQTLGCRLAAVAGLPDRICSFGVSLLLEPLYVGSRAAHTDV